MPDESTICVCQRCGRRYEHDYRRGHTKVICNSCRSNACVDRETLKRRMIEYKGGACILCGYARCLRALDFHHLDPTTKRFTIAGSHTRSWKALNEELDKCILVCSNCHGELEHEVEGTARRRSGRPRNVREPDHVCVTCGRRYAYEPRKGMTRRRCNTCCQNRATPAERHALKRWLIDLRGGRCQLCGYRRNTHVLTFHHVDPAHKRFNFSSGHSRSQAALRAEVAKCVLVCANCHDEIEAGQTTIPDHLAEEVRRAAAHTPEFSRRRPGRPVTREPS